MYVDVAAVKHDVLERSYFLHNLIDVLFIEISGLDDCI